MAAQLTLLNQRDLIEQALLDTLRLAFLVRQTVADVPSLQALAVDAGTDGALCYVTSVGMVYELRLFSGATQALPGIVAPTTPPAKYANARWIQSSSAVNWGPDSNAPLAGRSSGYCEVIDFFRGQGGTDAGLQKVLATKPSMLLTWESSTPKNASAGYPGAYYEYTHAYGIWCVSENDRGGPWSSWGDPVDGSIGANDMSAQVEYLFAGLAGSEAGAPRGNLGLQGLLWCEIGPTVCVDENQFERRFINSTEITVHCRFAVPDQDLVSIPPAEIWVEERLAQTGASRNFDTANYIAQGYMVAAPKSSLTWTWPAGVAVVGGTPVSSTPASYTFPANSDTYRDLKADGTFVYQSVARGGVPPSLTSGALRVGVTTTDASTIVQDRILCSSSLPFKASYQVVP